jgi:hypothetical protein
MVEAYRGKVGIVGNAQVEGTDSVIKLLEQGPCLATEVACIGNTESIASTVSTTSEKSGNKRTYGPV